MSFENKAGINVYNHYGPRDTGGSVGVQTSNDGVVKLVIDITPEMFNGAFIPPVSVPKGALFRKATLRVNEAFTLTGTTPALVIGAAGAETTNGITITKAELEAVGTKTPASTGAGTWSQASATGTTAAAKVGKALTGTSPAATVGAGKATLMLEFTNLAH